MHLISHCIAWKILFALFDLGRMYSKATLVGHVSSGSLTAVWLPCADAIRHIARLVSGVSFLLVVGKDGYWMPSNLWDVVKHCMG